MNTLRDVMLCYAMLRYVIWISRISMVVTLCMCVREGYLGHEAWYGGGVVYVCSRVLCFLCLIGVLERVSMYECVRVRVSACECAHTS
jgi:hypothetical protein